MEYTLGFKFTDKRSGDNHSKNYWEITAVTGSVVSYMFNDESFTISKERFDDFFNSGSWVPFINNY